MWIGFIKSLSGTLGEGSYPLEKGNYGLVKLLFGGTGPAATMILIVLLAVFSWLVWSTRRKGSAAEAAVPNAFAAAGVGCAVMLLSSPPAWVHYFVLLIPLSLFVIQSVTDGDDAALPGGLLAKFLAFFPLLLLSVLAQFNLGGNPRGLAFAFNLAAILTLALGMLQIRRQRLSTEATVRVNPLQPKKKKGSQ